MLFYVDFYIYTALILEIRDKTCPTHKIPLPMIQNPSKGNLFMTFKHFLGFYF